MDERKRCGFRRFPKGTLLFAGAAIAAVLLVYSAGVMPHHHDTGALRFARAGCGGHGACPVNGVDKDEDGRLKKACPLIRGEKENVNCPVKHLLVNRVVCPVMENRTFTADENTIAVEHEGRVYLLCCPPCKDRFEADPARYTRHHGDSPEGGHHGH